MAKRISMVTDYEGPSSLRAFEKVRVGLAETQTREVHTPIPENESPNRSDLTSVPGRQKTDTLEPVLWNGKTPSQRKKHLGPFCV